MPRDSGKLSTPKAEPYRTILALGAGGMGEVHLAIAQGGFDVKKLVVLKTLRKELLGDRSVRTMFLEEACLSARLAHPNVVQVHKVIPDVDPVIVMEYLDGQPLSAIQSRAGERFSTSMQLRIISHVLAGLHYSHELRDYDGTPLHIVHRDVSPQNVFVTYEGLVKILDFGLAKVATRQSRTKSGAIKGKIEYMPVEQLMGGEVDRRADIHAVGCMLWHACAGERLWANESEAAIARNLVTGNIPRPSSKRPVDPRLEAIVMKALAFDFHDRYRTALALQEALDEVVPQLANTPTMHETGAFVSALFAQERREMSETIHQAMNRPYQFQQQAHRSEKTKRSFWLALQARTGLRPLGIAGVLATVLALTAIDSWQILLRSGNKDPKPSFAARSHRPSTLRVSVSPRHAVVTIDNQPTRENPVELRLPPDNVQHKIRAALSGYDTLTTFVRLDHDVSLDLVLKKTSNPSAVDAADGAGTPESTQVSP